MFVERDDLQANDLGRSHLERQLRAQRRVCDLLQSSGFADAIVHAQRSHHVERIGVHHQPYLDCGTVSRCDLANAQRRADPRASLLEWLRDLG